MEQDTQVWYETRARILKGLSHPTRLFIVHQLLDGEKCVGELTALVGDDISTVSKHLSMLRGLDIIHDEKRGAQVYYRLTVTCIQNFYDCLENILRITGDARLARMQ